MAHDMEPFRKNVPDTYPEPHGEWYAAQVADVPSWMEARPTYHADDKIGKVWSDVMVWPRRLAIAFLWITDVWWKSGIAVLIVVILTLMYQHR
jgi:hypothetical protein